MSTQLSQDQIQQHELVGFSARMSGDTIGFTTAAYTTINFNTEIFDIGNCYDTTNKQFVAPVAGVYTFHTSVLTVNVREAAGAFYKNGALYYRFAWLVMTVDDTNSLTGSCTAQLAQGDTFDVRVYIYDSGDVLGGSGWSQFSGHLVGRV